MSTSHARKIAAIALAAFAALSAFAKTKDPSDDMDAAERILKEDSDSPRAAAPGAAVRPDDGKWSPIGLPFVDFPPREGGCNIYGLDIGICYPRISTVVGVQLGLFGAVSTRCYGFKFGLWGSSVQKESAGIMAGGVQSIADDSFRGVMFAPIGNSTGSFTGIQIGAGNVASPETFAVQLGILNSAMSATGFLVQLGLYNTVSDSDVTFVQVGLVNTSEHVRRTTTNVGKVKSLPFLRVHW